MSEQDTTSHKIVAVCKEFGAVCGPCGLRIQFAHGEWYHTDDEGDST